MIAPRVTAYGNTAGAYSCRVRVPNRLVAVSHVIAISFSIVFSDLLLMCLVCRRPECVASVFCVSLPDCYFVDLKTSHKNASLVAVIFTRIQNNNLAIILEKIPGCCVKHRSAQFVDVGFH